MTQHTARDLTFEWRGLSSSGTLHAPDGDGPHPVVLMLQGSGSADRESGGYFIPIRNAFLHGRIATFAYDKPGCGESEGDWKNYGLEDRSSQASAALDKLRGDPAIDATRIGVWGHSQGGWIVQILASRTQGLAFAIANSGPSIPVPEQNLYGIEHTMQADGATEDSITVALAYVRSVHEAVLQQLDYETVEEEILANAREQDWYGSYLGINSASEWELATRLTGEDYQPLDALQQIRCPFLAIYGGQDLLVPAWRGAQESGEALFAGGTSDATVVVFPAANHRIQHDGSDEFASGYLDLLTQWAGQRAGTV